MGYAEADPTMDVEGWDAAAKLAIMANYFFGIDAKPGTVRRRGITGISAKDISDAKDRSERFKLIASASKVDGGVELDVSPTRMPIANPLANIEGVMNALTLSTDCLGDVTIVGPGAGRRATGYSLLTDLISISRDRSKT
jgi:homoserine dehydrogenase